MKRTAVFVLVLFGILFAGAGAFSQSSDAVRQFVGQLEAGEPATYRNLTVVPG